MITPKAMRYFKLFRDPFVNDIRSGDDILMTQANKLAEAAITDAAKHGGFVALYGESGAGKSTIRRRIVDKFNRDGDVRVIYPQCIDKSLLTAGLILESIINDLAPGTKINRTNEARARQVKKVLLAGSHAGVRHVLLLEEAHDLNRSTLKQLKRLWEIEDGYRKVLGIVLIGQQELCGLLDAANPDLREVTQRCLKIGLEPLNEDLEKYVEHKLTKAGADPNVILADDWIDGVRRRLTSTDGRSFLYPLAVNNLIAKSMNQAAKIGEDRVTAEVVMSS